ncbi:MULTISPECIES: tail fiber domain-containing protein [Escherichia]|uniref:tail fiber domain-containing protein n=1 Tax=Escherichia TaxID=561 RepID=UPI0002A1E437|nr:MULTISPECIES: tail fiber domain-containing protein [Escherichia]MBY7218950.1 tail fiber domain-containing protein [Escherichia ruysiae]EFG0980069.1 tail fiber domain-containing protein [Escherichia coli]EFG1113161.1 tail fiber domain-containing protein [Escherichia coli]EGE0248926.1 tail fiber domain-containing protein [Escherichia coli]EIA2096908.1 tail fiber domain-containing protein [Escherichia coli]
MVTKTVIPDDIKTLKSDVSKLKTDQGSYATKSYVDNKTTWNSYCNVIYDQKALPTTGTIFSGKIHLSNKAGETENAYSEMYTRKNIDGTKDTMTRIVTHNGTKGIFWDFSDLYGGTLIFPGNEGYLKMGKCLMSYGNRVDNAIIKFDYTDTLQIKYANHGSTMTLNTQGTAHAGVTTRLWGSSSRPVVYEVGVDEALYMFYAQKTTSNTYELTVNGACNASAFNQGSDRDLKDNIQVIDNATDRIRKMNGYTYTLKENGMPYAGVIAQETLEAIPEAVGAMMKYPDGGSGLDGEEGERYYTVDYSGVTGLLVQVARESDDRITALEEENAELRQRLSAIEAVLASK